MLVQERHRFIARAIQSKASVSTIDLARSLRVSTETIRRDLVALEGNGILRRVYGGAVGPNRLRSSEPSFAERTTINADAKLVIGRVAAQCLSPGQTVFLDVGTTAQAVAKALAPSFRGTVVSHSLLVALELAKWPQADLVLAPGRLRRGEWSLSGTATHEFIRAMHFDVALLSCGGVDASDGATDFDFDDVEIKRTVAHHAKHVFVLADSSKHGVVGSYAFGGWYDVHGIITERPPPEGLSTAIRAAGGRIRLPVPPETDPTP